MQKIKFIFILIFFTNLFSCYGGGSDGGGGSCVAPLEIGIGELAVWEIEKLDEKIASISLSSLDGKSIEVIHHDYTDNVVIATNLKLTSSGGCSHYSGTDNLDVYSKWLVEGTSERFLLEAENESASQEEAASVIDNYSCELITSDNYWSDAVEVCSGTVQINGSEMESIRTRMPSNKDAPPRRILLYELINKNIPELEIELIDWKA
ncbi:hypothetical protein RGQ13_10595 [Thalassotalea psychrophila]|uniref:Ig-like domain-containing protein n=1 Tax=Thalassotalea psychrophila TaxID=3065647 RepID=A0ABY9TP10_9GAMM|nr:hypothetical protein RGQ13_10595 [Colwelliaceae bacterium SQ149]